MRSVRYESCSGVVSPRRAARFSGGPPIVRFLGRLSLTVGYFRLIAGVLGHPPLYGSNLAIRADLWRRIRATVHRDRRDVHDDLDLSLQIPPGTVVRYDPGLSVEVRRSRETPGGGDQLRLDLSYAAPGAGMLSGTLLVAARPRPPAAALVVLGDGTLTAQDLATVLDSARWVS